MRTRVCIQLDADFVFHLRMKKRSEKIETRDLYVTFPNATRFAAKAKTKLNDTGVGVPA